MDRAVFQGAFPRSAPRRNAAPFWIGVAFLAGALASCSANHYDPAEEANIGDLARQGCKSGDHVITRAGLNQVYEDSLVLWDGSDPATTFTVRFKGPGVARKTSGLVGKNRYERAYEALSEVKKDDRTVEVEFVCQGKRKTPTATRFSFRDASGDEVAFDF